eukprot:931734-Rhodomonas_salina.1
MLHCAHVGTLRYRLGSPYPAICYPATALPTPPTAILLQLFCTRLYHHSPPYAIALPNAP